MLNYELFKVNPTDNFLMNRKKKVIKELETIPSLFHAHEVIDNVLHLAFEFKINSNNETDPDVDFLNCFYFLKEKLMFVEKGFRLDKEFLNLPISQNLTSTNQVGSFSLQDGIHAFVEDLKDYIANAKVL